MLTRHDLARELRRSPTEQALLEQIRYARLPEPEREYRFHPKRRWRFDFAWPDKMVAVEVEGGLWTEGRHVRGKGYEADCEKCNLAAIMGWIVLRVTSNMVMDGKAVGLVRQALREEGQ